MIDTERIGRVSSVNAGSQVRSMMTAEQGNVVFVCCRPVPDASVRRPLIARSLLSAPLSTSRSPVLV